MNKLQHIGRWILLSFCLVSCRQSWVSVADISDQKLNRTVYLTGKVSQIAPLLDRTAYQLDDGTGQVWVITTQAPPRLAENISLKGQIKYQTLPFAEQELGELYLVELEQLAPSSDKTATP
ncbi:MAG: hypothetical protein AAFQ80_06140 [Cyanobacteria bacterium J06621_8]